MNNFQKILLALVIILIPISYLILNQITKPKVIVIPPIQIESNAAASVTKIHPKKDDTPDTILSNLKMAVASSEQEDILSEEEEAKEVLKTLQQNIHLPPIEEPKIATVYEVIAPSNVIKEKIVQKRNIQKHSLKKHPIKRETSKKYIVKKKVVHKKREIIAKKKVTKPKKVIIKKVIVKPVSKKQIPIITHTVTKKSQAPVTMIVNSYKHTQLSREEEVARYKQQHTQGLEIVGESKSFEIKDPTASIPDEYYFKKHNPKVNEPVELNQFVQTLGVVEVSKQYEVKNQIPQKVELAKDGVVDISTASVETEELRRLQFVQPLEVTEISEAFEATKAKKYLP